MAVPGVTLWPFLTVKWSLDLQIPVAMLLLSCSPSHSNCPSLAPAKGLRALGATAVLVSG